jgi:2-dehydro-3-deoxygalactonokinase
MHDGQFIAGDWGTSHLRLCLCDAAGAMLDTVNGPGAAQAGGHFPSLFASLTARWRTGDRELPAVLCGMVGSTLGWIQAPYVPCPAQAEQIAAACVSLDGGDVRVVPGLSCRNRFDAPDYLRGEETQILGALVLSTQLHHGRRLLCLPGTHTKWVLIEDGCIREFFSAPTGELFAVLRDHSVLVREHRTGEDAQAFEKGVADFMALPQASLLHRLFEVRGRQLAGELPPPAASAYLSGMLIASDVHGALRAMSDCYTGIPVVIGSPKLTNLYARVCALSGCDVQQLDGMDASLHGLAWVKRMTTHAV